MYVGPRDPWTVAPLAELVFPSLSLTFVTDF